MIKLKDGQLLPELLENDGCLSEKTIEQYDYIEFKNDFEQVIDIISTNLLVHSLHQECLKYEITEDLQFKIFIDENIKDYTLNYDFATNYSYFSKSNTSIIMLDRKAYDKSIEMCMNLLKKIKSSFDNLNEVEKFIIKSLEFDNPPETDEDLIDRLKTYKNGYYLSKKSAYIKMVIQLNIEDVKKRESDDFLKNMLADVCIVTVSNNQKSS